MWEMSADTELQRRVLSYHGACQDDALGLTETARECLQESRSGRNVQHQFVALLRQSVYSRLAGYEDTNDAERLSDDPTMRVIVGRRGGPERKAASTNTMSRFETEVLTQDGNVGGLARLNAKWVNGAISHTAHRRVILDMDSSESPVHGEQEGASYNGHFGSMCYHLLFVFNQFGDCEGAMFPCSRVPGSGVRGRGSGERETTASSLAGKHEAREKEDNSGQGKDGPAGAIAQGGNGR